MFYVVVSVSILVTMTLALIRAQLGPTVFDRILALNMFGRTVIITAAMTSSTMINRTEPDSAWVGFRLVCLDVDVLVAVAFIARPLVFL